MPAEDEASDDAAGELRELGAPEELIEKALSDESADEEVVGIWPENERAFVLFLSCRQQLQVGPMGGVLGLRAEGAEAVMRMKRVKLKDQGALLDDLQLMAAAYAEELNRKVPA